MFPKDYTGEGGSCQSQTVAFHLNPPVLTFPVSFLKPWINSNGIRTSVRYAVGRAQYACLPAAAASCRGGVLSVKVLKGCFGSADPPREYPPAARGKCSLRTFMPAYLTQGDFRPERMRAAGSGFHDKAADCLQRRFWQL